MYCQRSDPDPYEVSRGARLIDPAKVVSRSSDSGRPDTPPMKLCSRHHQARVRVTAKELTERNNGEDDEVWSMAIKRDRRMVRSRISQGMS